jgi:hypothetical protein
MKYSFFYVVGGEDKFYKQLETSMRSLKRLKSDYKIVVLDFGRKLKSENNLEVHYIDDKITKKEEYWKYKFYITQKLDTEYGIYLDCDTVLCYDRIEELCNSIDDNFGLVKHFYVQNFNNFVLMYPYAKTFDLITKYKIGPKDNFFCGGVFLFKKTAQNISILNEIYNLHNDYDLSITEGLYDETMISIVMRKYEHTILGGSVNHASCNHMDTIFRNGKIHGKNPFENLYEEIFILHGSSDRQKYGQDYEGDLRKEICKMWFVD